MRNVSIVLRPALAGTVAGRSARIRALLTESLPQVSAGNLLPEPVSAAASLRLTVSLDAGLLAELDRLAAAAGLSVGNLASQILEARHRADLFAAASAAPPRPAWQRAKGLGLRPEQLTILQRLMPKLAAGRLVLCEAGTGVGKSWAMVCAATQLIDTAAEQRRHSDFMFAAAPPDAANDSPSDSDTAVAVLDPPSASAELASARHPLAQHALAPCDQHVRHYEHVRVPVIIAAPTVQTLMQLVAEWQHVSAILQRDAGRGDDRVALVLGRGQFVDRQAIADTLEAMAYEAARRAILAAAAKTSVKTSAKTAPHPAASTAADADSAVEAAFDALLNEPLPADAYHYPAVMQWLADGCPAGFTAATQRLQSWHPEVSGLVDDLLALAPDFPIAGCYLIATSDALSQAPYYAMRAAAKAASVVFCTHAMLAMDTLLRHRSGIAVLPNRLSLLIDEAHDYERAQASVASQGLALSRLLAVLRRPDWAAARLQRPAQAALKAALAAFAALRRLPDELVLPDALRDVDIAMLWPAIERDLRQLRVALLALLAKASGQADVEMAGGVDAFLAMEVAAISPEPDPDTNPASLNQANTQQAQSNQAKSKRGTAKPVKSPKSTKPHLSPLLIRDLAFLTSAAAILAALVVSEQRNSHLIRLTCTPVRRWPTIDIGPRHVFYMLQSLWNSCQSAALISATLLLPRPQGPSSKFIEIVLALPANRVDVTLPVNPDWLRKTPDVYHASEQDLWLLPPASGSASSNDFWRWHSHVAFALLQIAKDAAGGTLVLMTSYDRLAQLAICLDTVLGDRLLVQDRHKQTLRVCRERFKEMARAGLRPVWLAAGGAWTGLDLRDEEVSDSYAGEDLILTDLVMPNLPYCTTRSSTHQSRVDFMGPGWEASDTAMHFRQGIGRLVRRPGLQQRRLWLLDPRLAMLSKKFMTEEMTAIVNEFPKRFWYRRKLREGAQLPDDIAAMLAFDAADMAAHDTADAVAP